MISVSSCLRCSSLPKVRDGDPLKVSNIYGHLSQAWKNLQHGRNQEEDAVNEGILIYEYFRLKSDTIITKAETDELYAKIDELEEATKEANSTSDKFDADIRDTGKKVGKFETNLEEIIEKMMQSSAKMDEAEKEFKDKDDDVNAQSRRVLLLEEECRIRKCSLICKKGIVWL